MQTQEVPYWEAEEPITARGRETELRWFPKRGVLSISRQCRNPSTGYPKRQKVTLQRGEARHFPEIVALLMAVLADWHVPNDGGDPR